MNDPGHILSEEDWAKVVRNAERLPRRVLLSMKGGRVGASRASFPSVTGFIQAKWYGGLQVPKFGVLHDAETPLRAGYAASIANYFSGNTNQTSAHFMVDPLSTYQMLDTGRVGWHCGNGNGLSIGVEQAGYAYFSSADWQTPDGVKQMDRIARLMRDIRAIHGIGLWWMTDQQLRDAHAGKIVGGWATHHQVARVLGGTVHTDPDPNYPYTRLMQMAQPPAPVPPPKPTPPKPSPGEDMAAVPQAEWTEALTDLRLLVDQSAGPDYRKSGVWGWVTQRFGVKDQARLTQVDLLRAIDAKLNSALDLSGRPRVPTESDDVWGQVLSTRAEVEALSAKLDDLIERLFPTQGS